MIPKPGKSPTQCSNYRPISLINIDLKLYAKLNGISFQTSSIIDNTDQVGFAQGREARDNTIKTLSLTPQVKSKWTPFCLLEVDAEKALDQVLWEFLWAILELGLGGS